MSVKRLLADLSAVGQAQAASLDAAGEARDGASAVLDASLCQEDVRALHAMAQRGCGAELWSASSTSLADVGRCDISIEHIDRNTAAVAALARVSAPTAAHLQSLANMLRS